MADKNPHAEYLELLRGLNGILGQLVDIAHEKIDSTRQGDLEALDRCMKQEQVFTLTLKTIEKKRIALLSQLGMGDVPLARLHEHYPQELRLQAKECAESLRDSYKTYESASGAARTVMERALRDIEKMFPEDQAPPPGSPSSMGTDIRA